MIEADVLVLGGGIAGLSIASRLSEAKLRVVVLERESATGYHSSGRSATYYHFGIGNRAVRELTKTSGHFFAEPPQGFSDVPLARSAPAVMVTRAGQDELFDRTLEEMLSITGTTREIDHREMNDLVPVLKLGGDGITRGMLDVSAARLDGHALMMGHTRVLTKYKGLIVLRAEVVAIERRTVDWLVETRFERYAAPILVNAAGAWADFIAELAGVAPLGLQPLRRTIIAFDPPTSTPTDHWPLVRSLANEFYFLPETGRILASPADETPSAPCDAQPDEYDVALAAWRIEEFTSMKVSAIRNKWAGLRTFTADRVPVAGFSADADGFFWLAGQGGYGLQTSPAMSTIATSMIIGAPWPDDLAITSGDLSPLRLRNATDLGR